VNIVIIEDNPIDAQALSDVLERAQFESLNIRHYERLEDVPPAVNEHNIDVILLDLTLGETRGVATVIGARSRLPNVPLVVMTADSDQERAFEMLRNGAEDYLIKGAYSVDTLRRAIRYALERHSLKASLLRADRLAAVGQLAAGVAHEVSNPASFVLGHALILSKRLELLKRSHAEGDTELFNATSQLMEKLVEEVLVGIERISNVVRELQDYSRLSDSQFRKVDLNDVVHEASQLVQSSLRHRARLSHDLGPIAFIAGDHFKLEQVLTNLLVNATHAFGEGSSQENEVRVTTSMSSENSEVFRRTVIVSVEDNGSGIDSAQLPHIFKPFYTTKARQKGTGLGLSMAAEIVQMHGGSIRCTSKIGEGTRFELEFPAIQERPASTRPAPEVEHSSAKERTRILVVDAEHETVALGKAEEALDLLKEDRRFDLILCDFTMPGMGGAELRRRVSEFEPSLSQRFLFCTGGALTEDAQLIFRRERDIILFKPVRPQNLLAAIERRLVHLQTDGASLELVIEPSTPTP
jgi:signal transduction histidine kinase